MSNEPRGVMQLRWLRKASGEKVMQQYVWDQGWQEVKEATEPHAPYPYQHVELQAGLPSQANTFNPSREYRSGISQQVDTKRQAELQAGLPTPGDWLRSRHHTPVASSVPEGEQQTSEWLAQRSDAAKEDLRRLREDEIHLRQAMGHVRFQEAVDAALSILTTPEPEAELQAGELRPPPEHEDKPLHWVERSDGTKWVWEWVVGKWFIPGVAALLVPYDHASLVGYRYLGPAEWRDPHVQGRACEKQPDGTLLCVLGVDINDPKQAGATLIDLTKSAGEFRARIAELEAENARLRSALGNVAIRLGDIATLADGGSPPDIGFIRATADRCRNVLDGGEY